MVTKSLWGKLRHTGTFSPLMIKPYPCITQFKQYVQLKDYRPATKQAYVAVFGAWPSTMTVTRLI